ncbi:MAG: 4Fe-4S single cluster domain-containing protein [Bacteroidota bacterium]|nr:4Fe-4S single cluster domain-containing protein [Bacteroidota bacterium]
MKINVSHIEPDSYIYAPGKQFVIWMQGCSIHCKGCWNTEMWSFEANKLKDIDKLLEDIYRINDLTGVTFIGGEPFDQKKELLYFSAKLKKQQIPITIYTGYELDELKDEDSEKILSMTDLLIAGRYIEEQRNINLQWRGSENQQIIYLSDIYKNYNTEDANYCEIVISDTGEVTILGFPNKELLDSLK